MAATSDFQALQVHTDRTLKVSLSEEQEDFKLPPVLSAGDSLCGQAHDMRIAVQILSGVASAGKASIHIYEKMDRGRNMMVNIRPR